MKDKISPAIPLMETLEIKFPGGGSGNTLQCSCMDRPMDRGAWRATIHAVEKSPVPLSTHAGIKLKYHDIEILNTPCLYGNCI